MDPPSLKFHDRTDVKVGQAASDFTEYADAVKYLIRVGK